MQSIIHYLDETQHLHAHLSYNHILTKDRHRLEAVIRDSLAVNDHDRIAKIVHQLCNDYAYAVHQPHARNGGLIGLAAAAIALGGVSPFRFICLFYTLICPFLISPLSCLPLKLYNTCLTLVFPGCRPIPTRDCSSSPRLLLRSRCPSSILCLREHVQHCKSRKGRNTHIL